MMIADRYDVRAHDNAVCIGNLILAIHSACSISTRLNGTTNLRAFESFILNSDMRVVEKGQVLSRGRSADLVWESRDEAECRWKEGEEHRLDAWESRQLGRRSVARILRT